MATLIRAGHKPQELKLTGGEEEIRKLLDCPFVDQIPLGDDPKKPISRTVWMNEDREIFEMPLNEEATALVKELTTPSKEALTHRLWAVDEDGKEIELPAKTDTPSEFPPIRGDVIITTFGDDGL
jgi:hypothetical protein